MAITMVEPPKAPSPAANTMGSLVAHIVPVGADPVRLHHAAPVEIVAEPLLADRRDDHAAADVMLGGGHVHRRPPSRFVRIAQGGSNAAQREPVALLHDLGLLGVVDELDPLLDRALELDLAGRDLGRAAPVDHLDVLAAGQPLGDAAGIHGDIAAAHHHHRLRHLGPGALVHVAQELHAIDHAGVVLPRNAHVLAPPGADGEDHRVVALLELVQGQVAPERGVEVNLHPRTAPGHAVDVLLNDSGRQPERRNAPDHHAAEPVGHLVDVHRVARDRELVRRGQPGRPGAHHGDALRMPHRHRRRVVVVAHLIHDEALEIADLDGPVGIGAPAGRLATVRRTPARRSS